MMRLGVDITGRFLASEISASESTNVSHDGPDRRLIYRARARCKPLALTTPQAP
jgi:hypothetical protein